MKKAFLCGINYTSLSANQLHGCIDDINNVNNFLSGKGYTISILTDDTKDKPTKQNMINNFNWLVKDTKAGDTLFIYYSGHGSNIPDTNGDEISGQDNVLVPLDYQTAGVITDDWLFANVASKLPAGVTLWCFTDCCHSGTMLDLEFNYQYTPVTKDNLPKKIYNSNDWLNQYGFYMEKSKVTNADIFMFSGCLDSQTSADAYVRGQAQGAFSSCFMEFVQNNATNLNNVSLGDILKEINCRLVIGGFQQRSQLSCGKGQDISHKFTI